ncbi:hypothetical protein AB832_07465 [Flavobacteriaceae bacterium (ex Bugula neritina AB1)]|nr:hypothetical protein AB832_07465 [Flavobacteriaceae bacterium (ex Bugula neritina AB1)]
MYYKDTKTALLCIFSIRGEFYSSMPWMFEDEHRRMVGDGLTIEERLTADGLMLSILRKSLTEFQFNVLKFCYTHYERQNSKNLYESWQVLSPVIKNSSRIARRISKDILFSWTFDKNNKTGHKIGNYNIPKMLNVNESTVYRGLTVPVKNVLNVASIEDLASQMINSKKWYI